jgi:hypothetical protein
MASWLMRGPMRSVDGLPRTQGPRSVAGSAARPRGGCADADLADRDRLPSRGRLTGRGAGYNSQDNENMARPRAGYPGIGGQYLRIRTLLVGGADWLARRRRGSPAGGSGAGSATHRGSGMYLDDFGHKGPAAPRGGGVRANGRHEASGRAVVRAEPAGAAPARRPGVGFLRQGCARLAERIRVSAGVTTGDAPPEQRAVTGTPWLGLLLWFAACAGLFVSLSIRPDNTDRYAARSSSEAPIAGRSYPLPLPTLAERASEVSLIASPRLPPRWAAD